MVRRFLVRDLDSWLLPCGRAAVTQWEESGAMFHVMRDHPAHYGQMLAGLWGGHNYHNLSLAAQLSQALFSRPATGEYTSDQRALEEAVWHSALIHDSYRCLASHRARYGQVVPFPTRRQGAPGPAAAPPAPRCCGWRLGRVLGSAGLRSTRTSGPTADTVDYLNVAMFVINFRPSKS